jgi:hypothetical protein
LHSVSMVSYRQFILGTGNGGHTLALEGPNKVS